MGKEIKEVLEQLRINNQKYYYYIDEKGLHRVKIKKINILEASGIIDGEYICINEEYVIDDKDLDWCFSEQKAKQQLKKRRINENE